MEAIDIDKYQKPKYSIPYNSQVSKDDKKYYMAWAEAVYSYWLRGKTGITYAESDTFAGLRLYGSGMQSEDTYKNLLMGKPRTATDTPVSSLESDVDIGADTSRETKRRGYMNLLWDIVSPADKMLSALIGKLSKLNTEISVDAIDPVSKDEAEMEKFDLLRYMENKDWEDGFRHMAGIPAKDPEFMPDDREELDLYAEEGGFKTAYSIAMEEFAAITEEFSSWDEIRDELTADMINLKVTGVYPYYDDASNTIRFRYLDPEMAVIQHSSYKDYRDAEYGGVFEFMPLSEFIEKADITDEREVEKLMKSFSGKFNNPHLTDFTDYSADDGLNNAYVHDSYKILVLRCWWIDNDVKKDLIRENQFGEKRSKPYEDGDKVGKGSVRKTSMRMLYTTIWGVGTDYMLEYGLFKDIIKKNKNEVNVPQFMYRAPGRSLTKQIKPFYDALQNNWLKYQDAMVSAKKSGYVIDYNAIANLKGAGGKNPEKETIKKLMQTGNIIVKMTNIGGRPNTFQKPVYELTGGIGKQLEEFITAFEFNTRMIESFTGINPITLGSAPEADAAVRNVEMSVAGTDNNLQTIVNGITRIQKKLHDYNMDWFQILLKHNSEAYKVYEGILGTEKVAAVKAAMKHNALYGCFLTPGITDQEKQEILESAKISLQNGREGKPGITEADFALILRQFKAKTSSKLIFIMLDKRIKKAKKEAAQQAQESATADRQAQAENDKAKHAQEMEKLQKEHDYKMDEIKEKGNQDLLVAKQMETVKHITEQA